MVPPDVGWVGLQLDCIVSHTLSLGLTCAEELLHHNIKGATTPCIVSHLLRMLATATYGPKLLIEPTSGPIRDLEIQFLTVDSGNLV